MCLLISQFSRRYVFRSIILSSALLAFSCLSLHKGERAEFSPNTFQHRAVEFYYIPYLDVAVWSSIKCEYEHPLVSYWRGCQYDVPQNRSDETWDTITGWCQDSNRCFNGPAKRFWYLCGCSSVDDVKQWIAWSLNCADLAKQLWPSVIQLLRTGEEGYGRAALLMIAVRGSKSQTEYDRSVNGWRRAEND